MRDLVTAGPIVLARFDHPSEAPTGAAETDAIAGLGRLIAARLTLSQMRRQRTGRGRIEVEPAAAAELPPPPQGHDHGGVDC